MNTAWVLVANASEAKLFAVNKLKFLAGTEKLQLLQEFSHPQSRMKAKDLASDKLGHFQGKNEGYGSFVEKISPKEHEIEVFAKELSDVLDAARANGSVKEIILVAPPQFYGLMNKHFHQPLKQCISKVIEKDYTKEMNHELETHLLKHL